jgi:hypothetical protein
MLNISLYRQICDYSKPSVVVFCRRCFSGIPKNGFLAIRGTRTRCLHHYFFESVSPFSISFFAPLSLYLVLQTLFFRINHITILNR